MNWAQEVETRRKRFVKLAQARKLCVESGDRVAVMALGDCMRRARDRLLYAEKMEFHGAGIFTPRAARFATSPGQAPSCDGAKAGQP